MKRASSLRSFETPNPSSFSSRSILSSGMSVSPRVSGVGLRRQLLRRRLHGLDDVLVAGAPAEVARHPVADLLLARVRVLLQQTVRARDHSRRAEAALQAVILVERLLQRVQLAALREALDRQDVGTFALHGEHRARLDRHAVQIDRARAAVRRLAADVWSGVLELLAQRMNQKLARLDDDVDLLAVQLERHRLFLRHVSLLVAGQAARVRAVASARIVISPAIAVLYSTSPRWSGAGAQMRIARRAASA